MGKRKYSNLKFKKINPMKMAYYTIVFLCIAFRCLLQSRLPIWANGEYYWDDMLLCNYANTIKQGEWLGTYSNLTLCKVPGYSIFLVINDLLHLPYMLTAGLAYSMAAFLLLLAMQKVYKKKVLPFLLFLYILFSPVYFEVTVASRLYCLALVPTVIVFIFAGTLGTFAERKSHWTKKVPWLLVLGGSYGFYTWLRADSAWVTCFVGAAVLAFIIEGIFRKEGKKVLIFLLPLVICFASVNVLCAVNYSQYGVYAMSDFTGTAFSDMCKELMKIKPEKEKNRTYVSLATMKKAAKVSETFQPLYKQIKKDAKSGAAMGAEFYVWEIRSAMQSLGYYEDAAETNAFYKQVTADIQQAFADGIFEKREALVLSPFAGPIYIDKIGELLGTVVENIAEWVVSYKEIYASTATFTGTANSYSIMCDLTNTELIHDSLVYEGQMQEKVTDTEDAVRTQWENAKKYVEKINQWIDFCKKTGVPIAWFVLLVFIVDFLLQIYLLIKRQENQIFFWILKAGTGLALLALTLAVTVHELGYSTTFGVTYGIGTYSIWQIFVVVNSLTFGKWCENFVMFTRTS